MATHTHKMANYGQCDSYFVEDDSVNSGVFVKRAETKEHIKAYARLRQKHMAEQLSLQTSYDYQDDILDHMEHMETETMPDVSSIDIQTEIQWFMRPYLIDFLVEAHAAFQLLPETLYLAVNILDRYCSKRVVYKRHYQLVGCAALLIAAKFGDRKDRVPLVKELRSMCCMLYDEEMFIQMEWHVLLTLNWTIGHPTVDSFLQIALSESTYDREAEHMTWYICEMALYHKEFISVLPSSLARAGLCLSRCILGRDIEHPASWANTYDTSLVVALLDKLSTASGVLQKKFQSTHYSMVSGKVYAYLEAEKEAKLKHAAAALAAASSVTLPPATPTIPTYVGGGCDSGMVENNGMPVTPVKHQQHLNVIQHGYATPPITPDQYSIYGSAGNDVHGNCGLVVPGQYSHQGNINVGPGPTPPQQHHVHATNVMQTHGGYHTQQPYGI